jgi:CRISPR-associated protein Cas4
MLNEYVYCPRLFFYEWVEGVFVHSADTVEGAWRHERVDARGDSLPAAESLDEDERVRARSVSLTSDVHGVTARIDMVEAFDGVVLPIDYKKGRPRETDEGPAVWPADEAQVCVQALVLRDSGYTCHEAIVYYHATRQRVRVAITEALVGRTLELVAEARRVAASGQIPPPLADSRKCPRCSLVGVCLPDETRAALAWTEVQPDVAQPLLFPPPESPNEDVSVFDTREPAKPSRQLFPARDDLRPLYVTGFGMTVGRSGDVLEVRVFGEPELMGLYRVDSDGTIRLPLIGDVKVDGITPDEAHARIEAAYNGRYLKDAQVTVFVKESNSRRVVVLGEVKSPGSYPYEERMTIIGAIARAGGTSKLADLNRTLITRERDGTKVSTQVRVGDIRSGRAADVEVFPGDIVYIPETLF